MRVWTYRNIPSNDVNGALGGGDGVAAVAGAVGMEEAMHLAGAAVTAVHVEVGGALLEIADVTG